MSLYLSIQQFRRAEHAGILATAKASHVAIGEASSIAFALAADFAAGTTTLHLARAASVPAIRNAASLCNHKHTMYNISCVT